MVHGLVVGEEVLVRHFKVVLCFLFIFGLWTLVWSLVEDLLSFRLLIGCLGTFCLLLLGFLELLLGMVSKYDLRSVQVPNASI